MSVFGVILLISLAVPLAAAQSADGFNAKEHKDWGSYYDPQNIFCGKFDCYKILGFDYESFGKSSPDSKEITKRYRSLSREWHPDKNRSKDAKDRFVKIARAYEVLTNKETREEYDLLRYNQNAYFKKYGASVLWQYAPKSDVYAVIVAILGFGTLLSWFIQKQHWQNVANRLIRASVEDLGPREGGTPESKAIREKALKIMGDPKKTKKQHNKAKLTTSEKRKQAEDALRPIVTQLVNEITDFGAGYHKPTWRDLLVVKVALLPVYLGKELIWHSKYAYRRMMNLELNDEEREVLTRRAVGEINWASATEEERKDMCTRDLWLGANMMDWEEEKEIKLLSPSDQKKFNRLKKKGKQGKVEDWKTE